MQQFLGVCNYYRRFVLRHNDYITPFRDLLKKYAPWFWTEKHSDAFRALKINFANSICLSHVIPGVPFKAQCDASDLGIGGILYQIDDADNHRIISVASRCLTHAEALYTTTEKELLAVVYCVTKFREHLIGQHFEIITDHKCLTFLNSTVYHNARLIRWNLLLQQYSYSVSYCRGVDNVVADFLSRNPGGKFAEQSDEPLIISSVHRYHFAEHENHEAPLLLIMALHSNDASLQNIMQNLADKQRCDSDIKSLIDKLDEKTKDNFQIYHDVLFHRENESDNWRAVIPEDVQNDLIKHTHEKLGHPGVFKTLSYMKKYYYWRRIQKDVKKFVLICDLCQRIKYLAIAMEGEYKLVAAAAPNDLITVDFYGPLPRGRGGVCYLFVVLDAFSKIVRMYPMKKATTYMSLKKLTENYIPDCGKPQRVLSDNGTQFTSPKWRNRLELEGIKVIFSSVRHPQSNPTERVMREIGRLFRTFCNKTHTNWPDHVRNIENLLNITTHYSTRCTPTELHFGTPIHDQIERIINFPKNKPVSREYLITLARESMEKNYQYRKKNQKLSRVVLNVGDLVLLRVRHLSNAIDKVTRKFFHLLKVHIKSLKS